jgi:hypothetical protein
MREESDEQDSSNDDIGRPGNGINVGKLRVKQPSILIFDSLAGATRSRVYATLREYLREEYKVGFLELAIDMCDKWQVFNFNVNAIVAQTTYCEALITGKPFGTL